MCAISDIFINEYVTHLACVLVSYLPRFQPKKKSIHSIAKTLAPKKYKPWTMRPNGFVGSV